MTPLRLCIVVTAIAVSLSMGSARAQDLGPDDGVVILFAPAWLDEIPDAAPADDPAPTDFEGDFADFEPLPLAAIEPPAAPAAPSTARISQPPAPVPAGWATHAEHGLGFALPEDFVEAGRDEEEDGEFIVSFVRGDMAEQRMIGYSLGFMPAREAPTLVEDIARDMGDGNAVAAENPLVLDGIALKGHTISGTIPDGPTGMMRILLADDPNAYGHHLVVTLGYIGVERADNLELEQAFLDSLRFDADPLEFGAPNEMELRDGVVFYRIAPGGRWPGGIDPMETWIVFEEQDTDYARLLIGELGTQDWVASSYLDGEFNGAPSVRASEFDGVPVWIAVGRPTYRLSGSERTIEGDPWRAMRIITQLCPPGRGPITLSAVTTTDRIEMGLTLDALLAPIRLALPEDAARCPDPVFEAFADAIGQAPEALAEAVDPVASPEPEPTPEPIAQPEPDTPPVPTPAPAPDTTADANLADFAGIWELRMGGALLGSLVIEIADGSPVLVFRDAGGSEVSRANGQLAGEVLEAASATQTIRAELVEARLKIVSTDRDGGNRWAAEYTRAQPVDVAADEGPLPAAEPTDVADPIGPTDTAPLDGPLTQAALPTLDLPPGVTARLYNAPFPVQAPAFDPAGNIYLLPLDRDEGSLLRLSTDGRSTIEAVADVFSGLNRKRLLWLDGQSLLAVDFWPDGGNALGGVYRMTRDGDVEPLRTDFAGLACLRPGPDQGTILLCDFERDGIWQLAVSGGEPENLAMPPLACAQDVAISGTTGWFYAVNNGATHSCDGQPGLFRFAPGLPPERVLEPAGSAELGSVVWTKGGGFGGGLLLADPNLGAILRFDEQTGIVEPVLTGLDRPWDMAATDDGSALAVLLGDRDLLVLIADMAPDREPAAPEATPAPTTVPELAEPEATSLPPKTPVPTTLGTSVKKGPPGTRDAPVSTVPDPEPTTPSPPKPPAVPRPPSPPPAVPDDRVWVPFGFVQTIRLDTILAVENGPRSQSQFRIDLPMRLMSLTTYHWNDARGARPGPITLMAEDGTRFGPWLARGRVGQGGVPDAYWDTAPDIVLQPGTYTVLDSDPATWATNAEVGWQGIFTAELQPVRPEKADTELPPPETVAPLERNGQTDRPTGRIGRKMP